MIRMTAVAVATSIQTTFAGKWSRSRESSRDLVRIQSSPFELVTRTTKGRWRITKESDKHGQLLDPDQQQDQDREDNQLRSVQWQMD